MGKSPTTTSKTPSRKKTKGSTPENAITLQRRDINLQLLDRFQTRLQKALSEDSLQNLTPLLQGMLLNYQRSLIQSSGLHIRSPSMATADEVEEAPPERVHSLVLVDNILPQMKSYINPLKHVEWASLFGQIPSGTVLWCVWSRKITRVTDSVIVKKGRCLSNFLDEIGLLQFVKENTTIPVPEVLGLHYTEEDECYLFMSLVEGCTLASKWEDMSTEDKHKITSQLVHYISQLRSLEPQQPINFGSVVNGICRDVRREQRQCRFITSEQQFNDFLGDFTLRRDSQKVRMLLSSLRDNHKILLTHGDLHPRNIMVQGSTVTGIIDWEYGGWYPEYWEFLKGLNSFDPSEECQDWWEYLMCITGEYRCEWAIDSALDHFIVNSPPR
jgi:aminoglycoside phosphotransferase